MHDQHLGGNTMTTIDHAAEALGLRALASEAPTEAYAANLLAAAQVHATLALVDAVRELKS